MARRSTKIAAVASPKIVEDTEIKKIFFGNDKIKKLFFGNLEIDKIYFGSDLIYSNSYFKSSYTRENDPSALTATFYPYEVYENENVPGTYVVKIKG